MKQYERTLFSYRVGKNRLKNKSRSEQFDTILTIVNPEHAYISIMSQAAKNPEYWGINNDFGVLRDVLLGEPKYFKWVEARPLIGRTLRNMHKTGISFDYELAQRQFDEMVGIYQQAGVTCHYLEPDPVLHRNFFARDSSAMTP
ncbi:MAG: hypothetical protein P8Y12_09135, partial [Gammaproteobacteria bacterium]